MTLEHGRMDSNPLPYHWQAHELILYSFQERVLSRRVIYFVGDKIFFRCRAAEHAEHFTDILSQNREVGATIGSMLPEAILMKEPLHDFVTMLFYYTKRALTSQDDAPRAMAGIIRRFAEAMKCQFFQGLPTVLFDLFVVFHAFSNVCIVALPFQAIHG